MKLTTREVEKQEIRPNDVLYPDFYVTIRYVSPQRQTELAEKCMEQVQEDRRMVRRCNQKRLNKMLARECVESWRGLKLDYLLKMLPLDDESIEAIKKAGGELTFSAENAEALANATSEIDFMGRVITTSTDWAKYEEAQEAAQRKN